MNNIRKTAGGLLIETLTDQENIGLLVLKKIGEINVEVISHTTLNTTNGVVC